MRQNLSLFSKYTDSIVVEWHCFYYFHLQFVEYMVRNLKDSLKACKWDAARYSLRFLADLVNCHVISAGSLLQLLDNMVDAAKEDGVPQVKQISSPEGNVQVVLLSTLFCVQLYSYSYIRSWSLKLIAFHLFVEQVRKDWYVFAVLSTLPWVGRELYEKKEQALEHLLVSIEVFLGKRSKKHHSALRVWALDTPHPQEEVCLCSVLNHLHIFLLNTSSILLYCRGLWNEFCPVFWIPLFFNLQKISWLNFI